MDVILPYLTIVQGASNIDMIILKQREPSDVDLDQPFRVIDCQIIGEVEF